MALQFLSFFKKKEEEEEEEGKKKKRKLTKNKNELITHLITHFHLENRRARN